MVRIDLEGCEDSRQEESPKVFPLICQHDTCDHWWQISQSPYFPDVSSCDDNKEIGGESPDDRTESCQMLTEIEGSQQDVES